MPTPLIAAVRAQDFGALQRALALRAPLDALDDSGGTALWWAAYLGEARAVELLLGAGADPAAHDVERLVRAEPAAHARGLWEKLPDAAAEEPRGRPTLLHAVTSAEGSRQAEGRREVARVLLDRGFDLEAPDDVGCTPLHLAAWVGDVAMLELLLRRGAQREATDRTGHTALDHCNLRFEVVQTLLAHGASPDGGPRVAGNLGSASWTLLEHAAHSGRLDVVNALLGAGARLERHPNALNHAAWQGRLDTARRLLEVGARLDGRIGWRSRHAGPLECAAMGAHLSCVELLLEPCRAERDVALQAAVDYATDDVAPHGLARAPERRSVVVRLLDAGADPSPALLQAAHVADPDYARLLLDRGADVNVRDEHGDTPLHKAAFWHHVRTLEVLLRAGANAKAVNVRGEGAWDAAHNAIASASEHELGNVEALLRSAGGDPHARPRPPAAASAPAGFAPGDRVSHPSFGEGTVKAVQGTGPEAKVTVEFKKKEKKVLMARFLAALEQH